MEKLLPAVLVAGLVLGGCIWKQHAAKDPLGAQSAPAAPTTAPEPMPACVADCVENRRLEGAEGDSEAICRNRCVAKQQGSAGPETGRRTR